MVWTDRPIGVRWYHAADIRRTIKTDDWRRYPNLAEQSLHNWVGHDRTKRRQVRHDIAVFVLAQGTLLCRQRLHITQGRRDIEVHDRQDATKLGLHNRM